MVMPDKTIICKAIDQAYLRDIEVGGIISVIRPTDEGSCIIPARVAAISDKGEILAITPAGKVQKVDRRVFPRVKIESGIQLKLQFDRFNSRYKSMRVYDISGGGVGISIYAKNPIEIGQIARLEIEMYGRQNRINAVGRLVHCTLRNESSREYLLGIKFTEISELDQQKIMEYVANEQKKMEAQEQAVLAREKRLKEIAAAEEADAKNKQGARPGSMPARQPVSKTATPPANKNEAAKAQPTAKEQTEQQTTPKRAS
jgi:hypothetical protein